MLICVNDLPINISVSTSSTSYQIRLRLEIYPGCKTDHLVSSNEIIICKMENRSQFYQYSEKIIKQTIKDVCCYIRKSMFSLHVKDQNTRGLILKFLTTRSFDNVTIFVIYSYLFFTSYT